MCRVYIWFLSMAKGGMSHTTEDHMVLPLVESHAFIWAYYCTHIYGSTILADLKPSQCTFNPISLLVTWTFEPISILFHCNLLTLWKLLAFPEPPGSFIRVDFMFFIMHTASITSFTPAGGLFIPFSSDISFFVSVSNAYTNHVPSFEAFVNINTNSDAINTTSHIHH